MTLAEPNDGGDQHDERSEAAGGLVVAGGDPAEVLELVDEAFDDMAFLIEMPIVDGRLAAGGMRRNHDRRAEPGGGAADGGAVIGAVGDDVPSRLTGEQGLGAGRLVGLAAGELEPDELAQRIDQQMQLAAQPAAGAADRLIATPLLAPAAC